MIRKGLMIDPHTKFEITERFDYDDVRVDGMYVRARGELYPAAYIYPIESEAKVQELLNQLKEADKVFHDIQAKIFYQELPKLR